MPVGKWHALWASLRHMQSMQVHCPTHNEQCVISHNSKSTGTELTGWSHHVSHTYIAYRSSTPCTQQEVAAYNDGWSALRWHVTSIYTSHCYVALVSIAADLLWYSCFQSFQSLTKISGATCCRCSVHVASHWSHRWEDRKHSHHLRGHALALISVANEDVGPCAVPHVEVTDDASFWLFAGECTICGKMYIWTDRHGYVLHVYI